MSKATSILLVAVWALILISCHSVVGSARFGGGDGSQPDRAITIRWLSSGSSDMESEADNAENLWIARNFPGGKIEATGQYFLGSRVLNVFTIKTTTGKRAVVYFDWGHFVDWGSAKIYSAS